MGRGDARPVIPTERRPGERWARAAGCATPGLLQQLARAPLKAPSDAAASRHRARKGCAGPTARSTVRALHCIAAQRCRAGRCVAKGRATTRALAETASLRPAAGASCSRPCSMHGSDAVVFLWIPEAHVQCFFERAVCGPEAFLCFGAVSLCSSDVASSSGGGSLRSGGSGLRSGDSGFSLVGGSRGSARFAHSCEHVGTAAWNGWTELVLPPPAPEEMTCVALLDARFT